MTIIEALRALDGRPDLFAVRPSGKIISINNRGRVLMHGRGPKPGQFVPTRTDLVTDDWQPKTIEMLNKEAEDARIQFERAQAVAAASQNANLAATAERAQ